MSCNYADGLSPYEDKGVVGIAEVFDLPEIVQRKVNTLSEWIAESEHMVVYTGAGISTASGIPDFRGPNGVWTLEKKGLKPEKSVSFDRALPTATHMAIVKLVSEGVVKHVVSQNIDGLHLKSGLSRDKMTELHGNIFIEKCSHCQKQFIRRTATSTVGQVCLDKDCPSVDPKPCRGKLHDIVLDWEDELPAGELEVAEAHSMAADVALALGTTLQINPSGSLPINCKKNGGKFVICNLQPTKYDRKADLVIHAYVDQVMALLMKRLGLDVPPYRRDADPTTLRTPCNNLEWTLTPASVKLEVAICKAVINARTAKNRDMLRQRASQHSTFSAKKPKIEINPNPDFIKAKLEPIDDNVESIPITTEYPLNAECEPRCEDDDIIAWRKSFNKVDNVTAKLNDKERDINEGRDSEIICLDDGEEDGNDVESNNDENANSDVVVSDTLRNNNDDDNRGGIDGNTRSGKNDDEGDRIAHGPETDNDADEDETDEDDDSDDENDKDEVGGSALPDNNDEDVVWLG